MTYKEYVDLVHKTFHSFNWRYGQSVMNVLHTVWREKHDELADTENDCYYDDSKVYKVLNQLEKEWKN
jgi:hypothetical protein